LGQEHLFLPLNKATGGLLPSESNISHDPKSSFTYPVKRKWKNYLHVPSDSTRARKITVMTGFLTTLVCSKYL